MTKVKTTISVNGGKEVDLDDATAAMAALTPVVERALNMTKPATQGDNSVKSYIDRAKNIMDEQDTLAEDMKELWAEAKGNGVDVKAAKAALKEIRKPVDKEFKDKVNSYLEVAGQFVLFA